MCQENYNGGPILNLNILIMSTIAAQENGTCEAPLEPLIGTATYPATSCRDISADRPSGYYWIQTDPTSCPIRVYCALDGSPCSCRCDTQEGGWMRVANFDMSDPDENCPDGFTQVDSADPPLRLCGRPGPIGCSPITFPTNGIEYSRVCGRVKAYRFASPDGFGQNNPSLDSHYIDGVSITHGPAPRTHIWSFVSSWTNTDGTTGCPCDTNNYQGQIPSYVDIDYFCEGGPGGLPLNFILFPDNALWDGNDCESGSMCCVLNNPPYFCKTLDAPTTNDIEVRLCGNQEIGDEDTPIEVVELYVY